MKLILRILLLLTVVTRAGAADFGYWNNFKSTEEFVAALSNFHPVSSPGDLASLFTVRELGQPDDSATGVPVPATKIASCKLLWSDSSHALVFATASPQTEATRSVVGVIFLLRQIHDAWQVVDHHRFVATGKYADVTARLTSGADSDKTPDGEPLVTVTESQGGRGYAGELSATYTIANDRIERVDLR